MTPAGRGRAAIKGANRMIHISRSVVGAAELEAMGRVIRDDGYLGIGRSAGF